MAKCFISPDGEYWETMIDASTADINGFPSGTVEVEQRPSHLHTHRNGLWIAPTDAVYDEYLSKEVRAQRDLLLVKTDKVISNPLRWADLSEEKKEEWALYRRALLDITETSGFPRTVVWPTQPQ